MTGRGEISTPGTICRSSGYWSGWLMTLEGFLSQTSCPFRTQNKENLLNNSVASVLIATSNLSEQNERLFICEEAEVT